MTPVPFVIAHRGASGYRPEHGFAAYRLAVQQGADAIEPDLVATRDGVLVLRHENEISGTTDVASDPAFSDRRTTKEVDGAEVTGWFTEDFTWEELSRLRIRERLPALRPGSASYDGEGRILRFSDLLGLLDSDSAGEGGADGHGVRLVAEIKHATYFASIGLPLDELVTSELAQAGWIGDPRLTVESFERTVLDQVRSRGVGGRAVYLVDASGAPADAVARDGSGAATYAAQLELAGLELLAEGLDGISLPKELLIDETGAQDPTLVARAHKAGLEVLTWTLRPENAFLVPSLRRGPDEAEHGDWESEFAAIISTGVDAVFADHPDLVRRLLDGRGPEDAIVTD